MISRWLRCGAVWVALFSALAYARPAQAETIELCPAIKNPEIYQQKGNEDYATLLAGKDDWLFRSRLDLKFRFRITDRTKDSFRRLNNAFKYHGTDLVIAMLPTRGMVHRDKLLPPHSETYDYLLAKKNYLSMLNDLRQTGLVVADMKDVDQVSTYYLKDDNHWTRDAAKFTAKMVADAVRDLPSYKSLDKIRYETSVVTQAARPPHRYLDFVNTICGTSYSGEGIKDTLATRQVDATVSQAALFSDDAVPSIVLLGTSESTNPEPSYANFEGFLKEYLQADILNEAVSGGSLQGSIGNFLLSGEYARTRPKIAIWEMNAYYGFNRQAFLREVVPAVYGQCTVENALESATGAVAAQETPLLQNLASKKYVSHRYYVALNLSNKELRDIKIRFIHADGRTDTVKLERSLRNFPQNPGLYFAELRDVMVNPLDQVVLETKDVGGDYDIRLCQTPETPQQVKATTVAEKQEESRLRIAMRETASSIRSFVQDLKPSKKYAMRSLPQQNQADIIPQMPDLAIYTREAVLEKMPALQKGDVKFEQMEGAPPLRKYAFDKRLDEFRDIQDRVEPKAIHIYSGVYDFAGLMRELNDPALLTETKAGYVLKYPIAIYPQAALIINNLSKPLLMSQEKGAFIASAGNLFILDAKIIGWNDKQDKPAELDETHKNFRPFITTWDGSEIYIVNSSLSNLGYGMSKSYGLTMSTNDVVQEEFEEKYGNLLPPTGWIIDSSFERFYFGFYSYEAKNVVLLRNNYRDNIIYGIDPHDRSDNLIIAYNKVTGSQKKHGIILSREVNNSYVIYNEVEHNGGAGIMLDRNCVNTVIAHNRVQANKGGGITIYESPDNLLYENYIARNEGSGVRIRNSQDIVIKGGSNILNKDFAFTIYEDPLTDSGRDFEMDPVVTRTSATIENVILENNQGLAKADGLERVRFENLAIANASLRGTLFGGNLAPFESDLKKNLQQKQAVEISSK